MIEIQELKKNFAGFTVLDGLNLHVKKGSIYGLIGTNGAGKTTLIKHLTGIYKQDGGTIEIDGQPVYENCSVKRRIGYIPDDLSFFASYSLKDAAQLYRRLYPAWDQAQYTAMADQLGLNERKRLSQFSKGMQKQAAFVLVLATRPEYLILDEPIDGLDPLVRRIVWKAIVEGVAEREMTVLVSSHNLREMEGICDSIGILSKGKLLIERDLDELKSDIHKIQVAFAEPPEDPYSGLDVLYKERRGSVDLLIVRNNREVAEALIRSRHPALFDLLPLSLEEIFIYELGGEQDELKGILL